MTTITVNRGNRKVYSRTCDNFAQALWFAANHMLDDALWRQTETRVKVGETTEFWFQSGQWSTTKPEQNE